MNIQSFAVLDRRGLGFVSKERRVLLHTTPFGERIFIQYPGKESGRRGLDERPWDFRPKLILNSWHDLLLHAGNSGSSKCIFLGEFTHIPKYDWEIEYDGKRMYRFGLISNNISEIRHIVMNIINEGQNNTPLDAENRI